MIIIIHIIVITISISSAVVIGAYFKFVLYFIFLTTYSFYIILKVYEISENRTIYFMICKHARSSYVYF